MNATPVLAKELHAQGLHLRCHVWPRQDARKHSAGLELTYGVSPSPLGPLVLAWFPQWGLCHFEFQRPDTLEHLRDIWPGVRWREDTQEAHTLAQRICFPKDDDAPLDVLLHGPAFHIAVWQALLDVPRGEIVSYQELARRAGQPRAARAVGTAMSTNPVAYVVPCHRVVRADGHTGRYGGGDDLKIRLLEWEAQGGPMPQTL